MSADSMPDGLDLVRTTAVFDETSVPAGLLRAHRIAHGVWGRLVVLSGSLDFVFEGEAPATVSLDAGAEHVIPPGVPHHLDIDGPVRFRIEFHR